MTGVAHAAIIEFERISAVFTDPGFPAKKNLQDGEHPAG